MKKHDHLSDVPATTRPGMGAIVHDQGVTFRVWAPFAQGVAVSGTFNEWNESANQLQAESGGYWAIDLANAKPGDQYKYVITNGEQTLYRLDPYARQVTNSAGNSIIADLAFDWDGQDNFQIPAWNELVIYEMHIGTFNASDGLVGTFQTAAEKLPYLRELGINAIEIMPPMEFPGGVSWGYNPALPFAIESDYGGPLAFKSFVREAHKHGIAVLLDIVFNHLGPSDLDLWQFDGWSENGMGGIYFYNDGRAATPWGDTRPDYARPEVRQYLRDNALYWLEEYRVDGLRWDATAYIRSVNGNDIGHADELPEGWSLMQWINEEMVSRAPGHLSIAEDLRGNEWLVKDTGAGGAGFGSQWDGEFVHPVRAAIIGQDDAFRDLEAVANALKFRYAGDAFKRVVYTESHDEVANGKARVPEEIWPGNARHIFAKKRSTLGAGLVFTAPGIPMIFQGQELLEDKWFSDTDPLNWDEAREQEGIVYLYRDLIQLRRNVGGRSKGLTGQNIDITHLNNEAKVLAYHRWDQGGAGDSVMVVANFSSAPIVDYALGFPASGPWEVAFDSHASAYDATFEGQVSQSVTAVDGQFEAQPASARVAVAPYSLVIFTRPDAA